ncbi:hypothetical protein V3C99_006842 [Haemonchus contortus]|uniref:Secreted protein n=1 Tax=Haemonchus contortus TaxID=6289 RepID=A0A7I4YPN1_HAECO|nr:unnamed protein product [Haemonchus contortus]
MRYSICWVVLATACSLIFLRITQAELSALDYRIAARADRNCFFSPIGCVFLTGNKQIRARRHKNVDYPWSN